jgi:beta-lactam-binding protein with PASTA domain
MTPTTSSAQLEGFIAAQPEHVPDLLRKPCAFALAELAKLHTKAKCLTGKPIDGFSPGQVNQQSVTPGTRLPLQEPVLLWLQPLIKKPQPPVGDLPLPDLVGLTCGDAATQVGKLGLRLVQCSPGAAKGGVPGRINAQSSPVGTPVNQVNDLMATVEPPPVPPQHGFMPDLLHKTCDAALASLTALKTKAHCLSGEPIDSFSPGQVNYQSVSPDTPLPLQSAVILRLQPPPPPPPPPPPIAWKLAASGALALSALAWLRRRQPPTPIPYPAVQWRAVADARPSVILRFAAQAGTASGERVGASWRTVHDVPSVILRQS